MSRITEMIALDQQDVAHWLRTLTLPEFEALLEDIGRIAECMPTIMELTILLSQMALTRPGNDPRLS